jgi:hypothetical protein
LISLAAGASRAQAPASELPIAVEIVQPPSGALDPAAIREAIARELGRPVVGAAPTSHYVLLRITLDGRGRAIVEYSDLEGEHLIRELRVGRDPRLAVELLALVAGNLARDQVSELVRRYARAQNAATAATPPPTAATPPPAPLPSTATPSSSLSVTSAPVPPPPSRRAPELRYRGRLGIYAVIGGGSSFQGAAVVPATLGLALRWRWVALSAEALGGLASSSGFVGGDLTFMVHHVVGPVLLGGGVGAGLVHIDNTAGIGRAFIRCSLALTDAVDGFVQAEYVYARAASRSDEQQFALASLGVQMRFFR